MINTTDFLPRLLSRWMITFDLLKLVYSILQLPATGGQFGDLTPPVGGNPTATSPARAKL